MSTKKAEVINHSWSVSGTLPNPLQRHQNYGENVYLGIVAKTMEEAMALARKDYPEIRFSGVQHRGDIHLGM